MGTSVSPCPHHGASVLAAKADDALQAVAAQVEFESRVTRNDMVILSG